MRQNLDASALRVLEGHLKHHRPTKIVTPLKEMS